MKLIALLIVAALAQAATPDAPAPAPAQESVENEIVVIGKRLETWRGTVRFGYGFRVCRTTQSTGDEAIDDIGCKALTRCMQGHMDGLRDATNIPDETAREAQKKIVNEQIGLCVRDTRNTLIAELLERRGRQQR